MLHTINTFVHCLYTTGGTLHVHFSVCSVLAVQCAVSLCAVQCMHTAQSMQAMCSHTLLACTLVLQLHCMYTPLRSGLFHFDG